MGVVAHQRLIAATAAALLAALTISCSSPADHSAAQSTESAPQQPDFTQVTDSMLIDASAIPDASARNFTAPVLKSDGFNPNGEHVDPPECAPIFSGPAHAQSGVVLWSWMPTDGWDPDKSGPDFYVSLAVPTGQPDLQGLRDLLGKCGTFQGDGSTVTMSPSLQLPGLPDSAVARRWTTDSVAGGITGAEIIGLTRGLYVKAKVYRMNTGEISAGDTDILVKLFNDQVAKLQAAD